MRPRVRNCSSPRSPAQIKFGMHSKGLGADQSAHIGLPRPIWALAPACEPNRQKPQPPFAHAEIPKTVVAAASFDDMIAITGYTIFINIAVQVSSLSHALQRCSSFDTTCASRGGRRFPRSQDTFTVSESMASVVTPAQQCVKLIV